MRTLLSLLTKAIFVSCFCLMLSAVNAQAATLTVTKTADTNDGVCDSDCSLREAIAAANPSGGDEIVFASPLFDTSQAIDLSIDSGFQTLVINKSLTITGKGANLLTVRRPIGTANGIRFSVFSVGNFTVSISGMTITNGYTNGNGGGISAVGSTLTVTGCNVFQNVAAGEAGGISHVSIGTLTVVNSTISGNYSNALGSSGGGIHVNDKLNLINSTVSGNVERDGSNNGGGVWVNGTTLISNSTIVNNKIENGTGAVGVFRNAGTLTVRSSIIAGNQNNSSMPDVSSASSTFTTGGYNIIGSAQPGSGFTDGANHDKVGTLSSPLDPRLDGLGNYGGATPTHRLQQSPVISPAIDKGNSFGQTTDQRGYPRIIENIAVTNESDGSDIGAYEADGFLTVTKTADTNDGVCDSDCSLREAIAAAGNNNTIQFSSLFNTAQTITLSDVAGFRTLVINKNLTINGKGANLTTIQRDTNSSVSFGIITVNAVNFVLNGVTITGGKGNINTLSGGIFADFNSKVFINFCHITNNEEISSMSIVGGGISSRGQSLTINNSTISNNRVTGTGGVGGGIYINAGTEATITSSTISGNTVSGGDFNGGGIFAFGINVTIKSSTITDNGATGAGSASGIYNNGILNLGNTIVAGNRNNSTQPDVVNDDNIFSLGFNLIGNAGSVTSFNQPSDQAGISSSIINPLLAPLAMNGGTTPTHALLAGSRALDKGYSFVLTTDQRGSVRPVDNPSILSAPGGDGSDIGAYEASVFPSIVVTKIEDTNDGVCDSDCSLREAIATAATGNTITFASPLFDTAQLITLSEAAGFRSLTITKDITINGKGAQFLTIRRDPSAAAAFSVFMVNNANFTLSGVTVSGGRSTPGGGGGITNFNSIGTNLTINACNITGNTAIGTIELGGGIYTRGNLYINNSTISNNTVTTNVNSSAGGGIYIFSEGEDGTVINNSTISGNTVVSGSGNAGDYNAGGIYNNRILTIRNSTVTDNGVVGANSASGIYNNNIATIGNTIVAGNRNNSTQPDLLTDITQPFTSEGFNLIGYVPSGMGFTDGVNNDRVGSSSSPLNPRLDALGIYGGATPTHRLQSNSLAIDKGYGFGSTRDQRGATRPVDISTVSNGAGDAADIGAYELQSSTSNQVPVANADSYTTTRNAALNISAPGVLSNDTDIDSPITAIKVTNPSHGNVTLNANGSFTYTPTTNYIGTDSFTYKANDGTVDSNIATVTITITNDAPVATADTYSTTRNTPLIINAPGVLSNDTDANNDSLTAIKVSNPSHGTVTLNANGSFTYTPTTNYIGADSFTYKANDGVADSNVVTVTLSVNAGGALSLTVTKTADTNDGVCDADCSLREAIAVAASGDTIIFASPLFNSAQTITLSETGGFQSLIIEKNLTITGKGANLLTVRRSPSATAAFRIFEIGTGFSVNISGMTISGGVTSGGGGGIHNKGTLVLNACAIKGNSVTDIGGGIYNAPNTTLTVNSSTISNNTTESGTGGGIGGIGTINITNSTISNNSSTDGGGIMIYDSTTLTVTSSTISNNSAQIGGGGIRTQNGSVTLRNTIVADNTASSGPDLRGTFTSQGFNLIGNGSGATITPTTGDQIGTTVSPIDPKLGLLQNNGGTTETRALFAGSPAIDKGNSFGSTTDQRGSTRPVDLVDATYPNASGNASDIGAFEAQTAPSGGSLPSFVVTKTADTNDGACDADCSLREAITTANTNAGPDTITFDIAGAGPHTIQLSSVLPELSQSVKLLNNSNESITVRGEGSANPYGIFKINASQIVEISGLIITNGYSGGTGGGITNNGTFTLSNSTVRNNVASIFGGGIFSDVNSALTVINSTFSGNTVSNGTGGAIATDGLTTITKTTISNNSASQGGGINIYSNANLTVTSSTISNNSAQSSGGGLYRQSGTVNLRNTIVADNTAPTGADLFGTFSLQGFNLIESVQGSTLQETQNAGTNIAGVDPKLGALQYNGGTTETRALLTGSPAIDKGNSFGFATDQRGFTRPFDVSQIPNASGDGSDIGAFEVQSGDIQPPVANPDSYMTFVNISLNINAPGVLSNDTDANGDTLSAIKVSDPSHGTLTLNANGSFTYTPDVNYTGSDSFTYKANDGAADSNTTIVTITVNPSIVYTVTKTQDTNDGVCNADCSLREAIAVAQSGETIEFSSLFDTAQTITLSGAGGFQDLVINKSLTINGKGANLLTINGNPSSGNTFRVFNINGSGVTVNLNNLTITGGNTQFNGGGINANGGVTLNISGCRIAGNNAVFGGGIYVANDSRLNLINSTVSNNNAGGGTAGGIANEGTLTVTNSTISNNTAEFNGGIYNSNSATLTNSTVSNNSAPESGGIYNEETGEVILRNTIVADNTAPIGADVEGEFQLQGFNLIENVSGSNLLETQNAGTNIGGVDPKLGALQNNGGTTETRALLTGSPAIDKGNSFGSTTDQRGFTRPFDVSQIPNASGGDGSDIGAFEVQTNDFVPPVANPDSYATNRNASLTVNAPGVLSNDTDANGDTLSAIKVSDPSHGTATLNANGSFTYTPTTNYTGADSFTYKANDGAFDSNVVTVTLTINAGTTLLVTKIEDTNDGVCDADCSLREAITASQSGGTIEFSSLFDSPRVISLLGSDTASGLQELVINKSLTINGKGANLLYIQRNDATTDMFRIFNITGNGVVVNLNNLSAGNGSSEFYGGGINVNGGATLNLTGCYIFQNLTFTVGGGIYVASDSALNVTSSTVFRNLSYGTESDGVGIHNEGILTVTNSTITENLKLHDSNPGGGGIWTNNTTTIINSTITNNNFSQLGSASGIFRSGNNGTVTIRSTIVAGNVNNSEYPDVVGAFASEGYNLIGNVGNATGFNQTGDQTGTSSSVLNPRLAPLNLYGGSTPTHALYSNSPAINAADPNSALATDQRGVARTIGGRADIGAFELNFTFSNTPTGGGQGTLPNGAIGQPYSVTFSANSLSRFSEPDSKRKQFTEGTPPPSYTYTLIAGSLPDGLSLNPNTGQLSGTPTQAGTFNFILKVTDNATGMSGAQAYVLVIGAPTAAGVTVSGRVLTMDGRGLTNARVVLTDSSGRTRTAITSSMGYYSFDDVEAGQTYVVAVVSKRYEFQQQVVTVVEEMENLNFMALSSNRR